MIYIKDEFNKICIFCNTRYSMPKKIYVLRINYSIIQLKLEFDHAGTNLCFLLAMIIQR